MTLFVHLFIMLASARRVLLKSHALVTTTPLRSTPTLTRTTTRFITTSTTHRASVTTGNKPTQFIEQFKQPDQATPSHDQVLKLLNQARTASEKDINHVITLIRSFYQPHRGKLSKDILDDIGMWKEAIRLGYSLHSRGHPNELSMLVNAFTKRFPTGQIKDNDALKVLIRVCFLVSGH